MYTHSRNRRFERLVCVSIALLVTTVLGVLLHAGLHPQIVA